MALFESYERRVDKINAVIKEYGINSIEECAEICKEKGIDPYTIVKETQPICFENACWAYTVGCAIAIKSGVKTAADAAVVGHSQVHVLAYLLLGPLADEVGDRKAHV